MFGLVTIELLAFTRAVYDLEAIRSFVANMAVVAEAAKKPRTRKKRDVVAIRPESGPDPPAA